LLNLIISLTCQEGFKKVIVSKPITKKKFVQIRGKQQTGGAKLSFKLIFSAHPSVFNVLSVNFTIIRIYNVMLNRTQRISIYTVSQKKLQNCFCQNFVKFLSILMIFGI